MDYFVGELVAALLNAPGYLIVKYGLGLEKKDDQATAAVIFIASLFFSAIITLCGVIIRIIFFRRT